MTAATASSVATRGRAAGRSSVAFAGLLWLTWRQHRLAILTTLIGIAALAGLLYWDSTDPVHSGSAVPLSQLAVPAAAGLIAIFWGAPLLAREYEQRTHLLAWSQDVSVARWLFGKAVVLAPVLIVLWAVLGIADSTLAHNSWLRGGDLMPVADAPFAFSYGPFAPLDNVGFEAWAPLQISYVLFGFALGVLVGALLRRSTVAIGVTLAVSAGVRFLVADVLRPIFLPPLRVLATPGQPTSAMFNVLHNQNPLTAPFLVDSGYLDGAGQSVEYPSQCYQAGSGSETACLHQHGVIHAFFDYQPLSRVTTFHLIEFGGYLALTVILLVAVGLLLRRWRAA